MDGGVVFLEEEAPRRDNESFRMSAQGENNMANGDSRSFKQLIWFG